MKGWKIVLAGAAAAVAGQAGAETRASLSSGVEYNEGKYGTGSRIRTASTPTTLRVGTGRVEVSASIPYQRVEGPGNVVASGSGPLGLPILVDPTRPATRQVRKGWGDTTVGAAYAVPTASIDVALTGQVKLPTASTRKGLGTGKTDYAVGAEASKALGRVSPFVGVGYTVRGDPQGYDLRNGMSVNAGAAVQLSASTRAVLSYGYEQAASRLVGDEHQVTAGLAGELTKRVGWTAYGSSGLSQGAPDMGAGVALRLKM